jgi:hypothetical protein
MLRLRLPDRRTVDLSFPVRTCPNNWTSHARPASIIATFGRTTLIEKRGSGSYASGDLAVLAVIERQHGEVGGLPDQDWSLRVTLVYRRQGAEWWLVHRHADPLVRNVGLETAAALARGANLEEVRRPSSR